MPLRHFRRLGLSGAGLCGATALGFWLGQGAPLPSALAQPPAALPPTTAQPGDYGQRVVAYIYGSVPITRQDLGEYLIERQGVDRLDLLINKKIIEHACAKQGIIVSPAEVEQALQEDLKSIGVDQKGFVN